MNHKPSIISSLQTILIHIFFLHRLTFIVASFVSLHQWNFNSVTNNWFCERVLKVFFVFHYCTIYLNRNLRNSDILPLKCLITHGIVPCVSKLIVVAITATHIANRTVEAMFVYRIDMVWELIIAVPSCVQVLSESTDACMTLKIIADKKGNICNHGLDYNLICTWFLPQYFFKIIYMLILFIAVR